MARKNKSSSKKRSSQKILDAFQIAERAENRSEDSDNNSGDDDDLEVHDGIMDASKFLANKGKDGGELSDEELDSDEALGSDDDFDILNSKFSQSLRDKEKKRKLKVKQKKRGEYTGGESESEDEAYDSIDESQLVTLSQAWDMDEGDKKKIEKSGDKNAVVLDDAWESESSEESESEDGEEEEEEEDEGEDIFKAGSGSDDEEVDLANTVSHLQSQLKKPAKEKKRLVAEATDENEFNLPTKGVSLSMRDMISAVDPSVAKDAILIGEPEESQKLKALATPLPKRIQERNDRQIAYEITNEDVSKWDETVQQNRQAEVLKFPLNPEVKHNDTATTFRATNEPSTELEKKIHGLLEQSALTDDKKEATFEEIAASKLSSEDLKKRTNELRLMRELMFRDEKRAKRIKKIKSKTFHKIKKKERLRNQEEVEGSDFESDEEEHDMKRAKERMLLKHKTQSKWAKSMIKSGLSKDASNRADLEEMLRQGEKLRSKQVGYEDGDQSDQGVSDIENEYAQDGLSGEQDELNRSKLGKGVLAMDFMKAAEQRHKQENLKDLESLKKMEEGGDIEDFEGDSSAVNVLKNQGRRVYTPVASSMKSEIDEVNQKTLNEIEDDEAKNLDNKLSKKFKVVDNIANRKKSKDSQKAEKEAEGERNEGIDDSNPKEDVNPWLADGSEEPMQKSKKIHTVDKSSSKLSKAAQKISKNKKRSASQKDNEDAIIDMTQTIRAKDVHDSENENSDVEDDGLMFKQKDLIKQAFAGDNVVNEFEREKRQVVLDEGDKEEDMSLPGWGDWAGSGKKKPKKKIVRKIDGVVQKDKRKDKNLKNVIINEKVNKKNLKYQSSGVPFPYESREQYERALRMPVGQEWTSRETHQKLTMPRIITKQGAVIDPLKAPFK